MGVLGTVTAGVVVDGTVTAGVRAAGAAPPGATPGTETCPTAGAEASSTPMSTKAAPGAATDEAIAVTFPETGMPGPQTGQTAPFVDRRSETAVGRPYERFRRPSR